METNFAATTSFIRRPGVGSTLNLLGVIHIYKTLSSVQGR